MQDSTRTPMDLPGPGELLHKPYGLPEIPVHEHTDQHCDHFNCTSEESGKNQNRPALELPRNCQICGASYELSTKECKRVPDDAAPTYISFGDEETTASVTTTGHLMQMSRFLGKGRSGFFCVDEPYTPEPLFVMERAQELMDFSPREGRIGLVWDRKAEISCEMDQLLTKKPEAQFIRDRWPRFTVKTAHLESTRHYFVQDNTVFDVWRFKPREHSEPTPKIEYMAFDAELLIRELDFVNSQHSFNETWRYQRDPTYQAYEVGNTIILNHDGTESKEIGEEIGLVVSFYVNGRARDVQRSEEASRPRSFRIDVCAIQHEAQQTQDLEVVTSYKLQILPPRSNANHPEIATPRLCRLENMLAQTPYARLQFSSYEPLNFIIRRTLEHILSVCSIPINLDKPGEERAIALTCGDLSGHRLVNKASFFEFQFLVSVFDFLEDLKSKGLNKHDREFCDHLGDRISKTCRAHLIWLFQKADRPANCFLTNYWATGTMIRAPGTNGKSLSNSTGDSENTDSHEALSDESLVNTPLQIIKLAGYVEKVMRKRQEPDMHISAILEILPTVVTSWLATLAKADKRGLSAFPRPETQEYRLRDHIWIWRALKYLEDLGYGGLLRTKGLNNDSKRDPKDSQVRKEFRRARDYSSAAIQSKVLKRFTTENPASRRRMIAVSRTSAETRFMVHTRDAALFFNDNYAFFDKAKSLLEMTMDAQKFHHENEDSFWNNPISYAVALLMAEREFQINTRSRKQMVNEAKRILIQISSSNGLFAGKINDVTKEPELFLDASWRDFYWHVGFEIPFALWNLRMSSRVFPGPGMGNTQAEHPINAGSVVARNKRNGLTTDAEESILDQANPEMKKFLPFNTLIDQRSITELPDEWLYSYPDFLDVDPMVQVQLENWNKLGTSDLETGDVVTQAIRMFQTRMANDGRLRGDDTNWKGLIIDVPKSVHSWAYAMTPKPRENPEDKPTLLNNEGVFQKLNCLRTAEDAKKRLIWMPNADHDTALLCFLGSPLSERISLASFFDKHELRQKFFLDETTATLNQWKTELHLSWYRLVEQCHRRDCEEISFLGGKSKLERAAMGFFFTGDFFDRYWTCRVLESDPTESYEESPLFDPRGTWPTENTEGGIKKAEESSTDVLQRRFNRLIKQNDVLPPTDLEKRPWRQRKVLELLLLDRMLQGSLKDSQEILAAIIKHLLSLLAPEKQKSAEAKEAKGGLPRLNVVFSSQMNSRAYMAFSKKWPPIQYTLQVLEDDLKSTLEMIKLWNNREKDREPEQPRWTKNDERKYRSAITKLSISNKQRVRELEQRLSDIQSVRTSLTNRLDSTRNELSFQSATIILFFTVITSVFLPLGFAAAIPSMNTIPGRSELTLWGVLAGSMLCITIGAFFAAFQWYKIVQWYRIFRTERNKDETYEPHSADSCGESPSNCQESAALPQSQNRLKRRSWFGRWITEEAGMHPANDEEKGPTAVSRTLHPPNGSSSLQLRSTHSTENRLHHGSCSHR